MCCASAIATAVAQDTTHTYKTVCDSFYWYISNKTYHSSCTDTFHYYNSQNAAILHLTAHYTTVRTETIYACDQYHWYGTDQTYLSSTSQTVSTKSVHGCDSTVHFNLILYHTPQLTISRDTLIGHCGRATLQVEGADSYTWLPTTGLTNATTATPTAAPTEPTTYTVTAYADTHYDAQTHQRICPATASVHVEVLGDTLYRYACANYIWDENRTAYNHSGHYTHHLRTAAGCDSMRVLILDVGRLQQDTTLAEACTRYYWAAADTMITSSGEYHYNTHHDDGCDSNIVLRVNVLDCPYNVEPDNVDPPACTSQPPGDAFGMKTLFTYGNHSGDVSVNCMSTPMTGDIDGDGITELIVCRDNGGNPWNNNGLLVIDGTSGRLKYTINTPWFSTAGQCMSIADVDGDGISELFLLANDYYIYCFSATGTGQIWRSASTVNARYLLMTADINGDGNAELVAGAYIFDARTGTLLLQGTQQPAGRGYGAPHCDNGYGRSYYMQALADIDHDGQLEIAAGNTLYKPIITNTTGTAGNTWQMVRQAEQISDISFYDGQTFLADFDNDGDVDVCVIGYSRANINTTHVYVWEGQSSRIIAHKVIGLSGNYDGTGNSPSIPFCGDLDGNGTPEIIFNHPCAMFVLTYDDTLPNHINIMHRSGTYAETAGFTVFDFNQDGKNEIVYRSYGNGNPGYLAIIDGVTLAEICPKQISYTGTICEYPIVADVNGDGHAEIISIGGHSAWSSGSSAGYVSVYGSQQLDAWGSARTVWNQWAYKSVNINVVMPGPKKQFAGGIIFPNGKSPINWFFRQIPHLDQKGDIYVLVSDVSPTHADVQYAPNAITVGVDYSNNGATRLNAPYHVALYCNDYGGTLIDTFTVNQTINVGDNLNLPMPIPMSQFCQLKCDSIAIALNDGGKGIGKDGNQQPECDIMNNITKVAVSPFVPVHSYIDSVACDSLVWSRWVIDHEKTDRLYSSTHITDTLHDIYDCDSIVTLRLKVGYSFLDSTITTVCDSFTWFVDQTTYTNSIRHQANFHTSENCDSAWILDLTVHPSYHYHPIDSFADTNLPVYFQGNTYYYSVHNELYHYSTIHGCDSNYYYTLVVDYHRSSCDGMLQFPNIVTPNGDGRNDRFEINNLLFQDCYPHNELIIYNRWGKRVYYVKDIAHESDFWNPVDMQSGTYFYTFIGHGTVKKVERHGVIEVINNN
ncbi:MAG: VCBS repeat-containing protein [Bacteroidales bacterium]|nr:VCBS repeat-containing protein [Candidatus Colimorpha onthohippi]